MARGFLSEGPSSAPRARVRLAPGRLDRDQRDLLLPAAPGELGPLAGGDARGLRVRGQRPPLHHARSAAAGPADAARELLRLGAAAPGPQARPHPVAAAPEPALRAAPARAVPRAAAAHDLGRRGARAAPRLTRVRPLLAADRGGRPPAPRPRGPQRVLPDAGVPGHAAPARIGARRRRFGRKMAVLRRAHRGLLLRAPARRRGALRERLFVRRASAMGAARARLDPRRARRVRVLRQ